MYANPSPLSPFVHRCEVLRHRSARLPQQHGELAHVEVDEVLVLVHDIRAEAAADDAVPRRVVPLVELSLDLRCHVLFHLVLLDGLCGDLNRIGLHLWTDVRHLDVRLPLAHRGKEGQLRGGLGGERISAMSAVAHSTRVTLRSVESLAYNEETAHRVEERASRFYSVERSM